MMQLQRIPNGSTDAMQDLYDFLCEAYDPQVQCSPVVQVLSIDQLREFIMDANLEFWVGISNDDISYKYGLAIVDHSAQPSARITWLSARKDYFAEFINEIVNHFCDLKIPVHGYIANEYLRNIYADIQCNGVISTDPDNLVVMHMTPNP